MSPDESSALEPHLDDMNLPEFDTIEIPDKRSFKIGEVAKLLDLEPYVLRYWEKEFDVLEPDKTDSGQRSYRRDDIQLLATIRELLYTEMFTIDGARRQLERAREGEPSYLDQQAETAGGDSEQFEALREENRELEAQVEKLDARADSYAERVDELEAELERARKASASEEYEARIEELETELERARQESATDADLEEENERLRRELKEARSRVEDLEARCRGLEQKASSRTDVLDDLRSEITELAAAANGSGRPRA